MPGDMRDAIGKHTVAIAAKIRDNQPR